jgi:serine phosphatase RsbU (regulator of sigma subunit)
VRMAADDQLLVYTDGILDAFFNDDDPGDARILAAIERHTTGGPPLLEEILRQVGLSFGGRPQDDDLTLLTARML